MRSLLHNIVDNLYCATEEKRSFQRRSSSAVGCGTAGVAGRCGWTTAVAGCAWPNEVMTFSEERSSSSSTDDELWLWSPRLATWSWLDDDGGAAAAAAGLL